MISSKSQGLGKARLSFPCPLKTSVIGLCLRGISPCFKGAGPLSVPLSMNQSSLCISPSRTLLPSPLFDSVGNSATLKHGQCLDGVREQSWVPTGGQTHSLAPEHAHPQNPVPPSPHPEYASVDEDTGACAMKTEGCRVQLKIPVF